MSLHPWGGRSYAISYNPQKISMGLLEEAVDRARQPGGVIDLPTALFVGHYHTAGYFSWGGTDVFMLPCLQQSVEHWRVKGNTCNIGILVVELTVGEDRAMRIVPEYHKWDHLTRAKDW